MMKATDFEFRNRWWVFGAVFGSAFCLFFLDNVPAGARLAGRLADAAGWPELPVVRFVFGAAAVLMFAAALLRTWGSAYLGREVVHDKAVHSETLHADGPYRHVRNPLYLGNILMAFAMSLFAPAAGAPLILLGIPLFCLRLIGREEAALEAGQGEGYRAFMRAVPRLLPSWRARIPAGGSSPDWRSGFAAEVFFWSFAFGVASFALTVNILWFYAWLFASPLLSWLAGLLTRKNPAGTAPGKTRL